MQPTIYVRLMKTPRIKPGKPIYLSDMAQYLAAEEDASKLQTLIVYRPTARDGSLILIDLLRVIQRIKELLPHVTIETVGESHTLVEIESKPHPMNRIFFVFVWLLLFCGSGLAIMNFHADVSMPQVHQRIVYILTGQMIEHPFLLQIPYSLGIGLGMIIFFNHVFQKKINEEPSPLEVEMFTYQENVRQFIIAEQYRERAERNTEQDPL
jgi:stage V sporulation protein AA